MHTYFPEFIHIWTFHFITGENIFFSFVNKNQCFNATLLRLVEILSYVPSYDGRKLNGIGCRIIIEVTDSNLCTILYGLWTPNEGQKSKWADGQTKNLDSGCNPWPCSAGHFVIMHPPFLKQDYLTKNWVLGYFQMFHFKCSVLKQNNWELS